MVRISEFMFNDVVLAKTKGSFYMFYRMYKQTKLKLSTIKKAALKISSTVSAQLWFKVIRRFGNKINAY